VLRTVDLASFEGEPGSFDKALAVNVNVFWTSGAEVECVVLRRVLRPDGVVRLVYDGPEPRSAPTSGERSPPPSNATASPPTSSVIRPRRWCASRGALRRGADHLSVDLVDLAQQGVAVGRCVPVVARRVSARQHHETVDSELGEAVNESTIEPADR